MWTVLQEKHTLKQLDKAPKQIQERFDIWKEIVAQSGPPGLLSIRGCHDHALKGQWQGARSSYLNDKWRLIYVIQEQTISVLVLEVTAHDYRKKG